MYPGFRVGVFMAFLLAAPLVRAAPPSAEIARAKHLFAEAVALEESQAWHAAAEKLRQAIAIKETPGLRYHLAHCEEAADALLSAAQNYERAGELIAAGVKAPDVERLLPIARQRIAARLPTLVLVVPAAERGVTVAVDGNAIDPGALGRSVPIDPGRHRITARAPGYRDFSTQVEIRTAESRTIELSLEPLSSSRRLRSSPATDSGVVSVSASREQAPTRSRAFETSSFGAREVTLLTEAALVLTGLGVGIGHALARSATAEDAERLERRLTASTGGAARACAGPVVPSACADLGMALEEHRKATALSTLGFIGAGVSAAAFALTFTLWPSSRKSASIEIAPRGVGFDVRAAARF
jgi:hypothetical protein